MHHIRILGIATANEYIKCSVFQHCIDIALVK